MKKVGADTVKKEVNTSEQYFPALGEEPVNYER